MNPIVKKDIINVLQEAIVIVKANEIFKLRELSDHVIHNASIFQDKDSISAAVTIYALSKLYRQTEVDRFVLPHLIQAKEYLEEGKTNEYEAEIKSIIKDISDKYEATKLYVQEVLELAQIKKASRMFEHGISMGTVADALGISIWDLMDYVGKTRIVDDFSSKPDSNDKLKLARELFGG